MSNVPGDLKYTKSHEWIRVEDDGEVTVGITDHAQGLLGDLVYVELPEVGTEFQAEEDIAVVESVKAASDVYAPLAGEVTAVNDNLADAPDTINSDAFGTGWIFRLKLADASQLDNLLDAEAYSEQLDAED